MEAISVYWIPIFELLDALGFAVFLVNRDAKHLPGRKTGVAMHSGCSGFIRTGFGPRASFRPNGQIAELRAYARQRERLLEYAASHI
jgi:transposase